MNNSYITVSGSSCEEIVITKSRFIGYAVPCREENDALVFLRQIRDEHRTATHHCYAYIIGENCGIMRYSDDGEPGGTAGMPIMDVMRAKNVVNCCIVVVRYFGGVLLGTGGLVRAYTQSAQAALEAAGLARMELTSVLSCELPYSAWDKFRYTAGLLPVQTFEGWDESGKYAVGVVIRGGIDTETVAECLRAKARPVLSRPEAGLPVDKALPTDDELVSQFGVRLFFDENGVPALLSFAQWGSAYTGTDEDEAEDAMDHAMIQADALANEQLTTFINSTISVRDASVKGEAKTVHALFDANGVPSEEKVVNYIDTTEKNSVVTGSDTMIGRSTVLKKVIVHPNNGHKLAVCVRMWSFGQYDAMKRVIERPKPEQPRAEAPATTPGKRRGRSYDF